MSASSSANPNASAVAVQPTVRYNDAWVVKIENTNQKLIANGVQVPGVFQKRITLLSTQRGAAPTMHGPGNQAVFDSDTLARLSRKEAGTYTDFRLWLNKNNKLTDKSAAVLLAGCCGGTDPCAPQGRSTYNRARLVSPVPQSKQLQPLQRYKYLLDLELGSTRL